MAVSEKSILNKIEKSSLAEELRKERENNDLAFNTRYSHKEDLASLLNLAESLKKACDSAELYIGRYRLIQMALIVVLVLLLSYWGFTSKFLELNYVENSIRLFLISFGAFNFLFIEYRIKEILKKISPEKFALSEVLQLLRETSNIIADEEEWSVLSRAEFRIRLSRFNLEEKSKSAFNFSP